MPGMPPVDAALWRRVVTAKSVMDISADDYAALPKQYRGVVDRRMANERFVRLASSRPAPVDAHDIAALGEDRRELLLGHVHDMIVRIEGALK